MKIPWRFIIGLGSGVLLGVGLFIGLLYSQLGVPTKSSLWAYSLLQKKEALAAQISGPRLFLVGGSNCLFGLSGQLIEEKTGYRTINFGSAADIGLRYTLYKTQKNVRPGDTVLLAIEYEFYSGSWDKEGFDDYVMAYDPAYFRHLSWLDKLQMATTIPFKRIQKGLRNKQKPEASRPPRPPYSPYTPVTDGIDCLNDNGDEIFNTDVTRPGPTVAMRQLSHVLRDGIPSEETDGFRALAAFLQWARANQVTVLATFPNIIYSPVYDEAAGKKSIATITDFYTFHGVPVIGTAREAMLPPDQFFDTFYHLTHEAALQRTGRLIPELKPYLHSSK